MVPAPALVPDLALEPAPRHRAHGGLALRTHGLGLAHHPRVAERVLARAHGAVADVLREIFGVREDLRLGELGERGGGVDAVGGMGVTCGMGVGVVGAHRSMMGSGNSAKTVVR